MKAWGILKSPIPYGIIWWLVFLKVLPQPPRPIGGLLAQIWGNHQGMGNNEIKARRILKGPISICQLPLQNLPLLARNFG